MTDFWADPFHHAALVAGFIAHSQGRLKESEYVRRLTYDLYEHGTIEPQQGDHP